MSVTPVRQTARVSASKPIVSDAAPGTVALDALDIRSSPYRKARRGWRLSAVLPSPRVPTPRIDIRIARIAARRSSSLARATASSSASSRRPQASTVSASRRPPGRSTGVTEDERHRALAGRDGAREATWEVKSVNRTHAGQLSVREWARLVMSTSGISRVRGSRLRSQMTPTRVRRTHARM